jgi:hypothetical protein
MASPDHRYPASDGTFYPTTRRSPLSLNTSHTGALPQRAGGNRFSYVETPVEMQEPQFGVQQRYIPGESPIRESPVSASTPAPPQTQTLLTQRDVSAHQEKNQPSLSQQQYNMPVQQQHTLHHPQEQYSTPTQQHRTSSPYNVSEPHQTHPAYFAPVADPRTASVPRSRPGSIVPPSTMSEPLQNPYRSSTMPIRRESDEHVKKTPLSPNPNEQIFQPQTIKPDPTYVPYASQIRDKVASPTQPIFAPSSLAGPNGAAPDLHLPGQVPHPNMTFPLETGTKEEWQHSLCECSGDVGTCLMGVICPCIIDSRTAYRLERKGAKKDPSDLLGFGNCNGRCGVMSAFGLCGLFCRHKPPHHFPSVSRLTSYSRYIPLDSPNPNPTHVSIDWFPRYRHPTLLLLLLLRSNTKRTRSTWPRR